MFYAAEPSLAGADLATNSGKKTKPNQTLVHDEEEPGEKEANTRRHSSSQTSWTNFPKLTAWDRGQVSAARSETVQAGKSPRGTAENKPDGSGLGLTTGDELPNYRQEEGALQSLLPESLGRPPAVETAEVMSAMGPRS